MSAPLINEKMPLIIGEIGAIPKTKKPGSGVDFAFRGIDDVMNHLNPVLTKHNVYVWVELAEYSLTSREVVKKFNNGDTKISLVYKAVVKIVLHFIAADGSEMHTEEVAMSEDYSDKAYTQAMSMAYKYAILRVLCIPTAELQDPDSKPAVEPSETSAKPTVKEAKEKTTSPKPKQKKALVKMDGNDMTADYINVITKLKSGMRKIEDVLAFYTVSPELEAELREYIPAQAQ